MLYPEVDLSDINRIFQCGLALVKEAAIAELPPGTVTVDTEMQEWLPPSRFLNAGTLQRRLVMVAKETAYE